MGNALFYENGFLALTSLDSPTGSQGFQTEAVVKWFNLTKGFGFVAPADGSKDAFMHSSVVNRAGMREVGEGTKLLVYITDGPKGRQVASIVQVLGGAQLTQPTHHIVKGTETEMLGVVKWYKADKGFGFVTPDGGERDVFVHRTVLERAGLAQLESGQRVKMWVQAAAKGYESVAIELMKE